MNKKNINDMHDLDDIMGNKPRKQQNSDKSKRNATIDPPHSQ